MRRSVGVTDCEWRRVLAHLYGSHGCEAESSTSAGPPAPSAAVLLGKQGPVVAGRSLESAVFAIEELEEAAKLVILTRGLYVRHLRRADIADLEATFESR